MRHFRHEVTHERRIHRTLWRMFIFAGQEQSGAINRADPMEPRLNRPGAACQAFDIKRGIVRQGAGSRSSLNIAAFCGKLEITRIFNGMARCVAEMRQGDAKMRRVAQGRAGRAEPRLARGSRGDHGGYRLRIPLAVRGPRRRGRSCGGGVARDRSAGGPAGIRRRALAAFRIACDGLGRAARPRTGCAR